MDYCFLKSVDYEIFLEIVSIDAAIGKSLRKTLLRTSKKHSNRQEMVAVRFLIRRVSQRMSELGRENGVWVKFWGIGKASVYLALGS